MSNSKRCSFKVPPIATALALLSSWPAAFAQPLPDKPPPPSIPPHYSFVLVPKGGPEPMCGRIDPQTTRLTCLQVIAREQLQLRTLQEQHQRGTLKDANYVELTAQTKAHIDADRKTMWSLHGPH